MPTVHPLGEDVTLAYFTPILARMLPAADALNRGLRSRILAESQRTGSLAKSNVGGWHSPPDLLRWPGEEIADFKLRMQSAIRAINDGVMEAGVALESVDADAWANVLRAGHYHKPHAHPGNDWSGVYYVATDPGAADGANSGSIEFQDPRPGIGMLDSPGRPFGGTVRYRPVPGLMLVFPSWLVHHVNPYEGPGHRISIAFNARIVAVSGANG